MDDALRVFALVARGFGAKSWNERYRAGKIVGANEPFAYGYFHANKFGCKVQYSEDPPLSPLMSAIRLAIRVMAGFDFIHAWQNRKAMLQADVVWTHTESQSLAIAALLGLLRPAKSPKLILQTVWLMDAWANLGFLRRSIYRRLLSKADVLTFHSPENLEFARRLFPGTRCELVLFGIRADEMTLPRGSLSTPVHVLSLGNDRHRDWKTLFRSMAGMDNVELTVLSGNASRSIRKRPGNVRVESATSNDVLAKYFRWADLLVVPLKPNMHASGITVIQEGILNGLPTIATDTGGLRSYFGDRELWYVAPSDPQAIREAIRVISRSSVERIEKVRRAQERMGIDGLSSIAFARRHAELSRSLFP